MREGTILHMMGTANKKEEKLNVTTKLLETAEF